MTELSFDDTERSGFVIRGWHVLAIMVAFFGTIIAVNTVFITLALQSFPGEEERKSYVQGLAYNSVLEERRVQAELGWRAAANLADDRVLISITDADGAPVSGLSLEGKLRHPADMALDIPLTFSQTRPGVYAANADGLVEGFWTLSAKTTDTELAFEMERGLWQR